MGSSESSNSQLIKNENLYKYPVEMRLLRKINIILIGKTGVGKSTLINSFFNKDLTVTGSGAPITSEIKPYTVQNSKFTIYDTPGLELNNKQQKLLINKIVCFIKEQAQSYDINQYIHFIFFCISSTASRIEDTEIDIINSLTNNLSLKNIHVMIILTKSYFQDETNELKSKIEELNLNICKVVPVLSKQKENYEPFGIDFLKKLMLKFSYYI